MTTPDQHPQPDAAKSGPLASGPSTLSGGYHSRGVPGEEGDARKRMRVLKVGDRSRINKSRPIEGGAGAEQASAARLDAVRPSSAGGDSTAAVFVIAKRGTEMLDTPVFRVGEAGDEEAVALFTGREQAQKYLDDAGWGSADEVGELSADDLLRWLVEAGRDGVRYATVNPDRNGHLTGHMQAVLLIDALNEESAESNLRQVTELARG